ncbi:UDP-glucose 4-epimerase GalE [Bacillus sp. Y1]|nr:UDP-glucose 4-epimerase GalE [Bacillus sp. Y1]AYA78059.1 UDP-glucose 4-epimerase GalE [Bacillus sp. Y1]
MSVLVTGGAGYIGSHTIVELLQSGYEVVVIDNLTNSSVESLNRVKKITGKAFKFYQVDLLDKQAVEKVFEENEIDSVIHFAGLKAVGESVEQPLRYYHNNITGTIILCQVMEQFGVTKLVFSSSATVYGNPATLPIKEDFPLTATNPYGQSKLMLEQILSDISLANKKWSLILLRYFNPIGAHESGLIGEDPNGIPNNIMPFITQVAVGKLDKLRIFGGDYPTIDGTGVRDYIHVVDLAKGHIKALEKALSNEGVLKYNLGTGKGHSVLQLVHAFSEASGIDIPYDIVERRPGDIAACYADPSRANKELDWIASKTIYDMCKDSWNWQKNNVKGYK